MGVRRPIKARDTRWAAAVASILARAGVRPNIISLFSVLFGAGAGGALAATGLYAAGACEPWLFLAAALCIQLRLLCNLFDGMVAIEGGFRSKSGEIFNELPDRFADAFIFIGAGYAAVPAPWSPLLGWLCAVLAILTAYVRALGVSAGAAQQFCGPMAKQHRMAVMTFVSVLSGLLYWFGIRGPFVGWALILIAAGCLITVFRRVARIIHELEAA